MLCFRTMCVYVMILAHPGDLIQSKKRSGFSMLVRYIVGTNWADNTPGYGEAHLK